MVSLESAAFLTPLSPTELVDCMHHEHNPFVAACHPARAGKGVAILRSQHHVCHF